MTFTDMAFGHVRFVFAPGRAAKIEKKGVDKAGKT